MVMKKELHRHHEDAGTALEILYGIVGAKTVVSWSPIYLLGLDIEREKTTVLIRLNLHFEGQKGFVYRIDIVSLLRGKKKRTFCSFLENRP